MVLLYCVKINIYLKTLRTCFRLYFVVVKYDGSMESGYPLMG